MNALEEHRLEDLKRFDDANAPAGRLRRYAQGRVRLLRLRLFVAAIGCVALAVLVSPALGLIAAIITVPLELAEHLVLRRLVRSEGFGSPGVDRRVAAAALLQTCGLGLCIGLAGVQTDAVRLLAWAFLLGAALNSMLTAWYHPPSHRARMGVLFVTALAILIVDFATGDLSPLEFVTEGVALGTMSLMMSILFNHLSRREARMRASERALLERSQEAMRLALVAEHASDSIILMDPDQNITWVNDQFTRQSGYSAEEALGRKPGDVLNHPDTSMAAVQQIVDAAQKGEAVNVRLLNRSKSGDSIWVETHQTPVFDSSGTLSALIAVERDVTEEVAHEAKLREAVIAAQEADREKAAFLSRMSHELRTPANGLVGGIELLRDSTLQAEQSEALEILDTSATRLMQLVENIVTVADAGRGAIEVRMQKARVRPIVETVLGVHQRNAQSRGLSLTLEVDPSAECALETDATLVRQILDRLVDNGLKFTRKGGVTVTARVLGSILRVEVKDTGVGIPADRLEDIFEEFTLLDDLTTRRVDGAGLGLASARELARSLGGRIAVKSEPGLGSVFALIVPIRRRSELVSHADMAVPDGKAGVVPAPVQANVVQKILADRDAAPQSSCAEAAPRVSETPPAPHDPMRLLVAEDNRTNRLLIKTMLKDAGHNLEFAEDGLQAVEQYGAKPPDFVLMDLSMPNKNGWDATRDIRALEARENLPRCPIVAVTANVSEEDQRKCFEAGMDAFLAKPLRKERLLKTISNVAV